MIGLWALRARKLLAISRDASYRSALRLGIAATTEHARVPFDHDARTVVDVGANRGQFAAFALRSFPRATIHSFEPLDAPRARLASLARRAERITIHAVALGASAGEATMHQLPADDSSSLLPPAAPALRRRARTVRVPMRRLDAVLAAGSIARPALLKIDVQGYELEVLRGAVGLLRAIDEIFAEVSFVPFYDGQALAGDVFAFLAENGFRPVSQHASMSRAGRVAQADVLFARVDRPSPA